MNSRKRRVWLVEDNEIIRHNLHELLEFTGYEVDSFEDAESALLRIEEEGAGLDALITDFTLPGHASGLDVATALRKARPELPVLLLTGDPPSTVLPDKTIVLLKPVSFEVLRTTLESMWGPAPAP